MTSNSGRSIIVAKDRPEDFHALDWAYRSASIQFPLLRCENGEEGIDYLNGLESTCKNILPPTRSCAMRICHRMGGMKVLRYIKTSDRFKPLPFVTFSSSANPKDIAECYREAANRYVVKPLELQKTHTCLKSLLNTCLVRGNRELG